MKLYLSSYRIPDKQALRKLLGKDLNETRMALIPNAKDYYAGRARDFKIQRVVADMQNVGFQTTVIDLKSYQTGGELFDALKDFDVLWMMGGNSFILRYEMERSGFSGVIRELLDSGVVYAGESAGALVAGNSLRGIEFADEPEFADEVIWDGLSLTNHFVLPHVGSPEFGDAITKAKQAHQDDSTVIEITDSQAFVVDGDRQYVVSAPRQEARKN